MIRICQSCIRMLMHKTLDATRLHCICHNNKADVPLLAQILSSMRAAILSHKTVLQWVSTFEC